MQMIELRRFDELLLTRERGRLVGESLPDDKELILDCRGVRAISPSFLDELIRVAARRNITLTFRNLPTRARRSLNRLERAQRDRVAQAV